MKERYFYSVTLVNDETFNIGLLDHCDRTYWFLRFDTMAHWAGPFDEISDALEYLKGSWILKYERLLGMAGIRDGRNDPPQSPSFIGWDDEDLEDCDDWEA